MLHAVVEKYKNSITNARMDELLKGYAVGSEIEKGFVEEYNNAMMSLNDERIERENNLKAFHFENEFSTLRAAEIANDNFEKVLNEKPIFKKVING